MTMCESSRNEKLHLLLVRRSHLQLSSRSTAVKELDFSNSSSNSIYTISIILTTAMAQDMPASSSAKTKAAKAKAGSKKRGRPSTSSTAAATGGAAASTSARSGGGVESSSSSTVSSIAARNAVEDDQAGPMQVQYIPKKSVDANDFGECKTSEARPNDLY